MVREVIWLAVTPDKYELPVAVADTAAELGKLIGKTANAIHTGMSQAKRRGNKSPYVKVVLK